jgi:HD-GYP domain-containing protein (c-di-GMP phosphodiesterase class II)
VVCTPSTRGGIGEMWSAGRRPVYPLVDVSPEGQDFGRGLRLAEWLGGLSLATDLAHQVPPETALKDTLLSVTFARHLGITGPELRDTYYLALVSHLGCTAYAEEQGGVSAGEDAAMRHTFTEADFADNGELARLAVTELAAHSGPVERARALFSFVRAGHAFLEAGNAAICEAAARLGERLGVGPEVSRSLNEIFARWDGKVFELPSGDQVSRISRITHLIRVAQIHALISGPHGAAEVVRKRSGGEFDPALADAFLEVYPDLFAVLTEGSVWDQTLDAEPEPRRLVAQSHLDDLTLAIADFTDIKSPFTLGHSRRVGAMAESAGRCMGMKDTELQCLRQTGHVHDLGSVSLPQRIWMKRGGLNRPELEAVHLHPYQTERILSCCRSMQPLGGVAGLHHERLDGSGYHRGAVAAVQPPMARLLATVEVYQSLQEERSWRPAFTPERAGEQLANEARQGTLDRRAVKAVLEAAGQPHGSRWVGWPSGLTDREVAVLRLLATGRSNRAIARILSVSEGTIRTHAENIYGKTGVHTRAGIGLFAIEHDLVALPKDPSNG